MPIPFKTANEADLRQALHRAMLEPLPEQHDDPDLQSYYALMRDYPERGGKLLRGQLLLLSTAAHGASWQTGLEVAAALELFQNWVLIHDDIEDGSDERRNQPALHRSVGVPLALNAGDGLHVQMWKCLHQLRAVPATQHQAIIAHMLETIERTAEGQHLDLCWVQQGRFDISEEAYLAMVTLKTAYYTVIAPLHLGALCAGATPDPRFVAAGKALGVAFQIRDDVLNLMPDISYGKEFAGDLYEAKRTLILAHFFRLAEAAERETMIAHLGKARDAKSSEDIDTMLALLQRYGCLDYAQAVAEARAAQGLALLQEALATLPNSTAVADMLLLLETLTQRRY